MYVSRYEPGMKFKSKGNISTNNFRHSWNAVKIYDHWYLMDCDWSARFYVSKELTMQNLRYSFNTFYFLTEPSRFIFTHFPDNPKWQLIDTPITLDEYEQLPFVKSFFFKYELEILTHPCATITASKECEIRFKVLEKYMQALVFSAKLFYDTSAGGNGNGTGNFNSARTTEELANYSMVEILGDQVVIKLRFPEAAIYRVILYARVLHEKLDPNDENARNSQPDPQYHDFCKYQIIAAAAAPTAAEFTPDDALPPFPPCKSRRYGLHTDSPLRDLVLACEILQPGPAQMKSTIHTDSGICELAIRFAKPVQVQGSLRTYLQFTDLSQLDRCIQVRYSTDTHVLVHLILPGTSPLRFRFSFLFLSSLAKSSSSILEKPEFDGIENRKSKLHLPDLPNCRKWRVCTRALRSLHP